MQYTNPIEILHLSNLTNSNEIDSDTIKKAKRRLFADIDLSDDGYYEYYGLRLTKGDCERVIEELANNNLKEFYLYLTSNEKLNRFLINGNEEIFFSIKQDSIFKLPEFIKFISPYFATKFDKSLLNAFEGADVEDVKSILKTSFLISQADINTAYKSVSNALNSRVDEISKIKNDIKNDESDYNNDDINDVVSIVEQYFSSEILNCLPSYFQSQILKIANEINYLNVAIWDNFDNMQVSEELLEYILTLNIDGLNKPTFEKNYEIVKSKNQERIEQEKNAPVLRKYGDYLIQTRSKLEEIEKKTLTAGLLLNWVNSTISISDVNLLPKVFDEIRNQVAISLRAMSVSVWNSYSNIDVSIDLINRANSITGLKAETFENLQNAKRQLFELKTKINIADIERQKAAVQVYTPAYPSVPKTTSKPVSSSSDESTGCLWVVGVAVVIWIIVSISKCNQSSSYSSYDNSPPPSQSYTSPSTENGGYSADTSTSYTNTPNDVYLPPAQSKYKGNRLSNGASPLNGCFGKGKFAGPAYITFDNDNSTDAIVCLVDNSTQKTIRNEYIRAGSKYTVKSIPAGTYYLKVYYGNDWNPTKNNFCGIKGVFESDTHFSKSDNFSDLIEVKNDGYSYTAGTITLYTVPNGNMSTESMGESEFFKN